MLKPIKLWIDTVNQKQGFRSVLKNDGFLFRLKTERGEVCLKVENSRIALMEHKNPNTIEKVLEGKEDVFLSVLLGERKLREAVRHQALTTTFSFRELLLFETLFYLAKPSS